MEKYRIFQNVVEGIFKLNKKHKIKKNIINKKKTKKDFQTGFFDLIRLICKIFK